MRRAHLLAGASARCLGAQLATAAYGLELVLLGNRLSGPFPVSFTDNGAGNL